MLRYIAFEGIDCAGKGAQIMLLSEWLEKRDFTPIRLFETYKWAIWQTDSKVHCRESPYFGRQANRAIHQRPGGTCKTDECVLSWIS